MAPQYGEVRVDYITYTTGVSPNEANVTVLVSGLVNNPTFSGNVIIEGNTTIDGDLTVSGSINASGVIISGITGLFDDGTEALPSIAFASDPDTGIYKPATNEIWFRSFKN
jgi:phage baseplate assembly protein gpV